MPASNESGCSLSRCDGVNVLGFLANISLPQTSNFGVARLDHDFGDKWHFMSSYRYYNLPAASNSAGGHRRLLPGRHAGRCRSLSPTTRSSPGSWWPGLTGNITNNFTNDIRYSYLRNWWQWGR